MINGGYRIVVTNGVIMSHKQFILNAYKNRDKKSLVWEMEQLTKELDELNVFFEEYLDVFSDEMSSVEDPKSPIWKAYKDKYKESEEIKSNIKLVNYYMGMI